MTMMVVPGGDQDRSERAQGWQGHAPPSVRSIFYFRDGGSGGLRDNNPGYAVDTAAGGEGRRGVGLRSGR